MSDSSRSPQLAELLRLFAGAELSDVHTAIPCRVESYDAAKQFVNVQPVIKRAFLDAEGVRQVERLPVIVNVPVQFIGGGGFRVTFPIAAGDTGMLLFSEASLDVWLSQGGEVDPRDERRFSLADGVFLPGVRSSANALTDAPTDRMTLGLDGGIQIHIDGDSIRLGTNEDAQLDYVVLYQKLRTDLEELKLKFNSHIHGGVTTGPGVTLVPSPPNLLGAEWPSDSSSPVVKAKT